MARMSAARAERVAKSHHCVRCGEYSYKRVRVAEATESQRQELQIAWLASLSCGICGAEQEVGLDDEGQIVYVG